MTKEVLITGANAGIGLATVSRFLEGKFRITALDKKIDADIIRSNKYIKIIEYDLENIDGINKLVENLGPIDILVNNAGIINSLTYENYDEVSKRKILRVNLEAPVALISKIAPNMIARGGGRIVNVSSVNGEIGHSDIWYGITKAGIINMTKSFSKAVGSKGIIINCVAPGPVDTAMLKLAPQERVKLFIESSIEKRAATADEIASTIFWLSTSSPSYLNGSVININNGIHL